ncbi:MAG TPA: hypothetical protein VFZ72_05055 [Jiangellaceae bacterium]
MGTMVLLMIVAGVILVAAAMAFAVSSSGQHRVDAAQRRADALADRNVRLERAISAAEQALRALASDTRLDAGMAVQIDTAIEDIRRARGDDPGLGH